MHCRFFGSAASQKAEGTRDAVDEATKLPLPSGQPRGAGTSRTDTDPHLPVTLAGTVCGWPSLLPQ